MDDLSVIVANLSHADRLLFDSWLLRKSHLADLAYTMHSRVAEEDDPEESEEVLASVYSEFTERLKEATESPVFRELSEILTLLTRVELCKALAAKRGGMDIPLWETPDPQIAYFHNPFAGRILHSVTRELGGGEAVTAEDYTDACEGVADGRYDLCLLPVESARDGVMHRFVQMIAQYDLFTLLTCRLEISEEEYIRFALLAASPCVWKGRDAEYLQIEVVTGEEQLWEILFVANQLGAKLAGCRPQAGEAAYQLTLQVEGADLAALQYYLDMGWSRATVTGYYRELLSDFAAEQGI